VLTDNGSEQWGYITPQIVAGAASKNFTLEELPIKLFIGDQNFGVIHMASHFKELGDVSKLLEYLFSKPNKIYCRIEDGKIKLEVFNKPPKHWGILELRKQDGCYSIVSAYPRDNTYSDPKGKLIWVRSSQSATSQATNNQPKNEISEKMLRENQAELTAQTGNNINPLQA
jgi:hypothetical protein